MMNPAHLQSLAIEGRVNEGAWAQLAEAVVPIRGVTFSSADASSLPFDGSIACLTTSGVQEQVDWNSCRFIPSNVVSQTQILRTNDILVSTANSKDLVGKSCLIQSPPFPCTFGAFVTVLRPNADVNSFYLASWLRTETFLKQCYSVSANTTGISNLRVSDLLRFRMPLPKFPSQCRIAAGLDERLGEVDVARGALEEQVKAAEALVDALLRESLNNATEMPLSECLREVTVGIGEDWAKYPVLGATRAGVASAKDPVGKSPQRYKPVRPGTIFYNPMRILLGSIAMVDEGEEPGITSPDYVVMTGVENRLHPRWFYYWFRSKYGAEFIKSLSRGAVRERLLFKRLAPSKIPIPDWNAQRTFARQLGEIRVLRIALREKLDSIEAIPTGLLREAFSGRI